MSDPLLEQYTAKLDLIPSLPPIIHKLTELIRDPAVEVSQIAAVMEQDPGITAKVLKLVNSAYYSIPGGVANLQRAITFLGFNTIYQVILSASSFSSFKDLVGDTVSNFWYHSFGTAIAAREIANKISFPHPDTCFTAGLLHDIGKIALAMVDPQKWNEIVHITSNDTQKSFSDAEEQVYVPYHWELGKSLAEKWKFPESIVLAISLHHDYPEDFPENIEPPARMIVNVVQLANQMTHFAGYSTVEGDGEEVDSNIVKEFGLDNITLDKILDFVEAEVDSQLKLFESI